jgi:hypothetical protein
MSHAVPAEGPVVEVDEALAEAGGARTLGSRTEILAEQGLMSLRKTAWLSSAPREADTRACRWRSADRARR